MQSTLYDDPGPRDATAAHAFATPSLTSLDARRLAPPAARRVLATAVLLGWASDTLLRDAPVGAAFTLWTAFIVANLGALAWRGVKRPTIEGRVWLAVALFFSCGLVLRDASTIQVLDVFATLGALTMAVVCMRDPRYGVLAARVRDTVQAIILAGVGTATGVLPLTFREIALPRNGTSPTHRVASISRIAAIVAATTLVFGALLRSADPVFASISNIPSFDFSLLLSHVFLAGVFTWLLAGLARSALLDRHAADLDFLPLPSLRGSDVVAVLIALNVLFGAFVATQIAAMIGGESFVKHTAGLTLAEYARHGFFQIVVVAAMVIPVIATTRAQLEPRSAAARRHTWLSLPVMALVGIMIASAAWRLTIYVRYFGLTMDRIYPFVFLGWLAIALVWLGLTTLREWPRPFLLGALSTGLATLATVNVVDLDSRIARFNVARAEQTASATRQALDIAYLATLGASAAPIAVDALIRDAARAAASGATPLDEPRCAAAKRILRNWGSDSHTAVQSRGIAAWRFWNADQRVALRTVSAHERELLAIRAAACPPPAAAAQR